MSAGINVEETACYFFSETFDFHHDFHGECEDCGRIVPEWLLLQCQYGFCGKFSCTRCGFRCRKCGDNDPRSVSLCSSHALLIYPVCDGCKKQFCDVCSQVSVAQVCLCSFALYIYRKYHLVHYQRQLAGLSFYCTILTKGYQAILRG